MLSRNINISSPLDRIRHLQEFTAALSQSLTPVQIGAVFANQGVSIAGAIAGSVFLITEERMLQRIGTAGYASDVAHGWGYFSLDVSTPATDCIDTGKPIWLTSVQEWHERYPQVPVSSSLDVAWTSIPLITGGFAIGCINLTFRAFVPTPDDKIFAADLAFQCAQALNRAQLYAAERRAYLETEVERTRLTTILDTISDGFITLDHEWRCTYINRCATQMLKRTRDAMLGQIIWDIFQHPPYTYLGNLREAVAQNREIEFEQQDVTLGLWLRMRVYPTAEGVTLYLQDITKYKQEEQARRVSETRFNHFMDANIIGILIANDAGDILDANDNFLQIIGYTRDDLKTGRIGWTEMTPPEYASLDAKVLEETHRTGKTANYEKEYFRKDGSRVPVLLGGMLDEHTWTTFVLDLSERKRIENEQRFLSEASITLTASLDYAETLENTTRLIVPALADLTMIYMVQPDNTLHRLIPLHTEQDAAQTGASLFDLNPPNMDDVTGIGKVLRTGQSELYASVSDLVGTGNLGNKDLANKLHALGFQSAIIVALPARGHILGAFMLLSGASGRHYTAGDVAFMEEIARRIAITFDNAQLYQQAQTAVGERNEFLSVAAHELKTPVTSLHGFAQFLLRRFDKQGTVDNDQLKTALRVIDKQSGKLSLLISQLLDVARLEAGRFVLEKQVIDLTDLVNDVTTVMQFGAPRHTLRVSTPPLLSLSADPLRLEQVLINLLDNAIKYSPDGGDIDVTLILASSESGEPEVILSVTDNGLGIPPEYRAQLFTRFYQAHGTGYLSGMGIGLYVSRQIVTLHGGQIRAEFPDKGGTRFVIRLPLVTPAAL